MPSSDRRTEILVLCSSVAALAVIVLLLAFAAGRDLQ